MRNLKAIALGLFLSLASTGAFSQCGTQAPANKFCGNDTGSQALATWRSVPTGALSPIPPGTILGNPSGSVTQVPSADTFPALGVIGSSTGQIGFRGISSGAVTLSAQSAAGSATLLLPTVSGTLVGAASAPLAISATTGTISITGLAGGVLAGAGPVFTMTPALGANGVATGSLAFNGFTSGSVVLTPQSAAGTPVVTFPNTSGTIAVGATIPLVLSATTGGLTCPTCVTSSGGGAITGTAPITVSAAGVVALTTPLALNFGGTNANLTASNGGIFYSTATAGAILAGTATAGQMLRSGATAAPTWSTATWPATTSVDEILFSSSANVVSGLATISRGVLVTGATGTPIISRTPILGVAGTAAGSIGFQNLTSGTITLAPVTGALGTVTLSLPAATDQIVARATTDTLTNKTYNAQGTGNVFQLDSVTVTGKASASDYYVGTSTAKLIAPSVIYPTEVDLGSSGSGTQTFDFSTFINIRTTMTGNISTQTLSNVTAGKAGTITFIQDGTGSRTTVWNTVFKFSGGTIPALSTTANAVDVLSYSCRSATFCVASLIKDVRNP